MTDTIPGYVGGTVELVTADAVTVDRPPGVAEDDLMLAAVSVDFGGTVTAAPTGWTLLDGFPIVSHTDGLRMYLYERIAGDAEPVDYTWTTTGARKVGAALLSYRSAIVSPGAVASEATRIPAPTIDPTVPTGSLTRDPETRWVSFLALVGGRIADLAVHPAQARRLHDNGDQNLLTGGLTVAAGDDVPTEDGNRDGQADGTLGLGSQEWDRAGVLVAVQHANLPPLAPDLADVDTFDATSARELAWTFADPNLPNDEQTARRVEIVNVDGTPAVDTGKTASALEVYDLAADTLTNEEGWQWRVKTWDVEDVEGPWSDWAVFRTSSPPTVAITAPTSGQVVEDTSLLVAWTFTHAERSQGWRQVELIDGGEVVADTGKVPTGQDTYLLTGLRTGKSYTLRVTVWSTLDQPSDPDTVGFTTDFPQPPPPTVTVDPQPDSGTVRVRIQNPPPGAGQVDPDWNDLYRREAATVADPAGEWLRIASGVDLQGQVDDRTAASGRDYEWRAVARNATFGDVTGDATAPTAVELVGVWLHDVDDPATLRQWALVEDRSGDYRPETSRAAFHGRTAPVVEFGEHIVESAAAALWLERDTDDLSALSALIRRRVVLCYRDEAGRVIFGTVDRLADADTHFGSQTTITVDAVDYDQEV